MIGRVRTMPATMATMLRTGRFEAFSDGVFAIAITLLVLEIAVPSGAGDDLLGAFLAQWPSYLAYLVSFGTIGVAWIEHTAITHYLHGVDTVLDDTRAQGMAVVPVCPFISGWIDRHDDYADLVDREMLDRVTR